MKLIEAVNANLAAQEMSQQRLPYDLALAVVKVKRATADETDFFLREERRNTKKSARRLRTRRRRSTSRLSR